MIAVPAVDLKQGRCVQLVGGRPDDERVSLADPAAVARGWWDAGFARLHVVDLDAALGSGDNRALVAAVADASPAVVQVGGGLRDDAAVDAVLALGVQAAVVGTRAVDDPAWLGALAERHPGRITVAADVRDGIVLRRGWTEGSDLDVLDFVSALNALPLAGVLCTDVAREGRLAGIDTTAMGAVVAASQHPVWISGGVTTSADLEAIEAMGAAGAVLGMALYTGALDAAAVAARWGGRAPSDPSESGSPERQSPERQSPEPESPEPTERA